MLRQITSAPGALQGLDVGQRIIEHSRYAKGKMEELGFEMLDRLWLKKYWNWAGHATRLPKEWPCAQWHQWRDRKWWGKEQQKVWGRRHQEYDANITRWETPLVKYSPWGRDWKFQAKQRERWQAAFKVFWEQFNIIHKRSRSRAQHRITRWDLEGERHQPPVGAETPPQENSEGTRTQASKGVGTRETRRSPGN